MYALWPGLGVNERFKNGQDMAAILDHSREKIAQSRIVLGFAMPLQLNRGRDLNVPAKLRRGVPAKKEAIEKGRLPLREVKIML